MIDHHVKGEEGEMFPKAKKAIGSLATHGTGFAFIRIPVGETDPRMIIDGHEQKLPTSAIDLIPAIAGDTVARTHDASQLLGINMQQITRRRMLIAPFGLDLRDWESPNPRSSQGVQPNEHP